MALPDVLINLQNGGLGRIAFADDRVVGLVLNGTPRAPFMVRSMDDYFDIVNPTRVVQTSYGLYWQQQVQDFFLAAGEGAELWVMIVDPTVSLADLFTGTTITTLMEAAEGRLNVIGVSRLLEAETPTLTEGLHPDTLAGMDEAFAWAEAQNTLHRPCRILLDGKFLDPALANLRNLKTHTFNRVGVVVGTNRAGRNAAMGLALGSIAAIPVHQNLGRFRNGSLPISEAYTTNNIAVKANSTQAVTLDQKGYIFLRKYPNQAGYYWVGDHMACADTDDFNSLANGRVADKVARLLYTNLLPELLDNVPVDTETGKIPATWVKNLQGKLDRAISLGMITNGESEISGVTTFIDPAQDILALSKLEVTCRVTPLGLARDIVVTLGFYNPNA
ncbi:DUF2586 family protein [Fibrella sp. WM1]|uniref:DUF2586 family protein n=1 Tax=Fibrella musci TaxID=3242485 RepID=UPI003522A3C0